MCVFFWCFVFVFRFFKEAVFAKLFLLGNVSHRLEATNLLHFYNRRLLQGERADPRTWLFRLSLERGCLRFYGEIKSFSNELLFRLLCWEFVELSLVQCL